MLAILDYDNVPLPDRKLGVEHVVRKLCEKLQAVGIVPQRLRVRAYGGWYEGGKMTRAGQDLATAIRGASPVKISLLGGAKYLSDIELVASSLLHPRATVNNTYRDQPIRDGIRCENRPWLSCANSENCSISSMDAFFSQNSCVANNCPIKPVDVLKRREQKVVDTLMVADLVYAAYSGEYRDAVVLTRDDDIWPGLCLAAPKLDNLIQVSTAKTNRMPSYYSVLDSSSYKLTLWG